MISLPDRLPAFFIDPSTDTFTLPVGIDIGGTRYRTVVLDEMTGTDEENISDKRYAKNGASALSMLLRRVIQAIPGLVEPKRRASDLIDEKIVRQMYQVDRDFLLVALRMISMDPILQMSRECEECGAELEESVDLTKFPVQPWPAESPTLLPFILPKGVMHDGKLHVDGELRFPTGADQERIAPLMRANAGQAQTSLFASITTRLGTIPVVSSDIIQSMKTRDRQALAEAAFDNLPGLRLQTDFICSACGDTQHDVPLDLSLFFSTRKAKRKNGPPTSSLTST